MRERVKGLVLGIFIGVMIAATTVIASNGAVKKDLHYNNIKITMNGEEIKPTDANGNYVEPFIIDGTTYLPVRGVANALGLGVDWDGATNTVKLFNDSYVDTTKTQVEKYVEIYGSLLEESFESGFEQSGLNCTATVSANGNKIIIASNIDGINNVSSDEKAELQTYFDENKSELKDIFDGIQDNISSLEAIIINVCEEDGDLIATIELEF